MKLSIVIVCWNDLKVIRDCLRSIYAGTHAIEFEVIVSDNGSTDGSVEFIRQNYPQVLLIENRANLGFSKGNNVGIRASRGEYVLILNPDTIIHDGALDKWIKFADRHPEAGGLGCRVLNPDGSYQGSARPFPTIWRDLIAALYLRPLAYVSDRFISDTYTGWQGHTERLIDWQSGCCVMFRGDLIKRLGGFDEQFFYHYDMRRSICVDGSGKQAIQSFTRLKQASRTWVGSQSIDSRSGSRWKSTGIAIATFTNITAGRERVAAARSLSFGYESGNLVTA